MSRTFLVFQHVPYEGPASISSWAHNRGLSLLFHHWHETGTSPPDQVDGLIIMGGPMNVNEHENYPWLPIEKQFIRGFLYDRKPVLGVCLGAQLMAAALGSRVYPQPEKELGWFPVIRAPEADDHPLLEPLPESLTVFHWHGDTFDLPLRATALGSTESCPHQGFAVDRSLALQFHLELNRESVRTLIQAGRLPEWKGPFVQSPEQIYTESDHYDTRACRVLWELLDRWHVHAFSS